MSERSFFWPIAERVPQLQADEVHVWAWELDRQPRPAEWDVLDAQETQRAKRFVYPQDRDRFVRAHSGMRDLLASYAQIGPAEIVYSKNAYGKPEMAAPGGAEHSNRLHFNLSHSANLAVLALSEAGEVGVDIEAVRPIGERVAGKYFSVGELQILQSLPQEMWLRGFYRCWTGKEALLKGEGYGLNVPLDTFDVEADPRLPAALLAVRPGAAVRPEWRLVELQPASGIAGTLAIQNRKEAALQCFTCPGAV